MRINMKSYSSAALMVCGLAAACSSGGGSISESGSAVGSTTLTGTPTAAPTAPVIATTVATVTAPETKQTPVPTAAPTNAAPTTAAPTTIPIDAPIAPASTAFALPDGFEYPEGVAVDPATGRAYVTANKTGAVAVAEPGADVATIFLPAGSDGRSFTLGIEFDGDSIWLVSPPGIWEYGTDGGLRSHHVADGSGLANDLAITRDGIYVTDSSKPILWFLARGSDVDAPLVALDMASATQEIGAEVVLNGIEALDDGTLVAGHFFNGMLFHIDPRAPEGPPHVALIDLGGKPLPLSDGMRRRGNQLWVSGGAERDIVNRVNLCPSYECGTVVYGAVDPLLSFPTDIEIRGDQLLVVNSQFDNGGGLGDGAPSKPFTVSAIPIGAA